MKLNKVVPRETCTRNLHPLVNAKKARAAAGRLTFKFRPQAEGSISQYCTARHRGVLYCGYFAYFSRGLRCLCPWKEINYLYPQHLVGGVARWRHFYKSVMRFPCCDCIFSARSRDGFLHNILYFAFDKCAPGSHLAYLRNKTYYTL